MALISLRIPDDVAARFSALAATEGGKSALLRRLIGDALGAPAPHAAPMPIGRPHKVTVRFRESEMRQLAEFARQRGMTRQAGSSPSCDRDWGRRSSTLPAST